MKDKYRHKGLRAKLITALQEKGIVNEPILQAMANIPRHYFLDKAFEEWAYKDVAFPIDRDQTISQPYTVARQSELLNINESKLKVLEIGTGSGYQAAILHYIGCKVYTIERHEALFLKTSSLLSNIGFNGIRTLFGDGYQGASKFAPFDRIIITAACPKIPLKLFQQLKVGGYMVLPKGSEEYQMMTQIKKTSDTDFDEEEFGKYQFVPFLEGKVTV